MPSEWLVRLYVKLHYMMYYIKNSNMYFKIRKLRNNNMVDTEHDSINWAKVINWLGLFTLNGLWWYSLFTKGLGITVIWTVVVIALVALWFAMRDNRV